MGSLTKKYGTGDAAPNTDKSDVKTLDSQLRNLYTVPGELIGKRICARADACAVKR